MSWNKSIVSMVAAFLAATMANGQVPFSLDTTFKAQLALTISGGGATVNSMLPLEDGSMLIAGSFRFPWDPVPPTQSRTGTRLLSNGMPDLDYPQFYGGGRLTQWNDRFYVGGANVRRRFMDGTVDPSFIPMTLGPYFNSGIAGDYHVFPDGRVLMTGGHVLSDTIRGFTGAHNFIWFSNEGYLDTTRIHRKGNGTINTLHQTADGKFIVSCGLCTMQEGQPVNRIFRLHADGAVDNSFQSPIDWGEAWHISSLEDGRILVSGLFKASSFSEDSLHIVRLMPDGSLDQSFNNEIDLYHWNYGRFVYTGHTQLPDGRIVLHGRYTEVAGQERNGVALLDQNGHLIEGVFDQGGCGDFVHFNMHYGASGGIVIAPDGMLYIHGAYQGYDDDPEQMLVSRLYPDDFTVAVKPAQQVSSLGQLTIAPNPAAAFVTFIYQLPLRPQKAVLVVRDVIGRVVHQARVVQQEGQLVWDSRSAASGIYTVEVRDGQDMLVPAQKLIREQ